MYTLPDLPYDYSALEPYIDVKTMEVHHSKHHQGYVNKTNAALEGSDWREKPIEEVIANIDQVPEDIRTAVRNNGGGVINHNFFWTILSPDGGGEPTGDLAKAINSAFGSFDAFKEQFSNAAATQFGSGWAWLLIDNEQLTIDNYPNQNSPLSEGKTPLLNLDVWEHAYYLKYQNRRPEYIEAFWHIVHWKEVERLFAEAQ